MNLLPNILIYQGSEISTTLFYICYQQKLKIVLMKKYFQQNISTLPPVHTCWKFILPIAYIFKLVRIFLTKFRLNVHQKHFTLLSLNFETSSHVQVAIYIFLHLMPISNLRWEYPWINWFYIVDVKNVVIWLLIETLSSIPLLTRNANLQTSLGSSIRYVRKIFRKTKFLTPWYAHVRVRIRGL